MKEVFNQRYAEKAFAYGTEPNEYLKNSLEKYAIKGNILLPADGEGRNGVYAAKLGLNVFAFDISMEGKKKAGKLALEQNVTLDFKVGDFFKLGYKDNEMDAAALIYAHFPPNIRKEYHAKIGELTKPGGLVILEGFSKNHLKYREENPNVGGPNKLEMLFSVEDIKNEFPGYEVLELEEKEIYLSEGEFHKGTGSVIRFVGRKK